MFKGFGFLATALMVALIFSQPAAAALSCSGGQYFAATGVSPSDPSKQQNAEACVTIGANTITVVLQNDDTVVTNIPSILDGFSIALSGAATGIAFAAVNPVVASGFIDCAAGTSCATVGTFHDYTGGGSNPPSPYEYGVVTGASGAPINMTFSTTDPAVLAGSGSLHPAGIIGTLASTGGTSQHLGDNGHNDYLLGPATFNLTYTGSGLTANSFTFYWGTLGESHTGQVPEPTSVLLLGTVLAFTGKFLKRRFTS